MKNSFFREISGVIFFSALVLSGCGGGSKTENVAPTISLTSIGVTPTASTILQGATQQFTATGTFSNDSSKDITSDVTWTSTDTTKVTINNAGLATGIGEGSSTIEAAYNGKANSTLLEVTATAVAPAITTQPADISVSAKQNATFSVVATGTSPFTYQWRKNGTNIAGATSSSYTTPETTVNDYHNAKYSVVVKNPSTSSATSRDATLTVTALPSGVVRILFLHHSTGMYVYQQGVETFLTNYNATNGTQYQIHELWYPSGSYSRGGNYPYDYWNLWVERSTPDDQELTLEELIALDNYDVIVFKHCYPVSYIDVDDATPLASSSHQTIANYKLQYEALKARMKQFPTKKFILWTGAALNEGSFSGDTHEKRLAQAQRAQAFFDWVKNSWDERPDPDNPAKLGDNIFIWDFYALETAGSAPFMNDNYISGPSDPHPNDIFSRMVAPYLAQRIVDVIEGNGDKRSITGQ